MSDRTNHQPIGASNRMLDCNNNNNNNNTNNNNNNTNNNNVTPTDNDTELLILIDSNSNHINHRLFWTLDKTKWKRCSIINEAQHAINEMDYANLKYVLLSVGVNDVDDEEGYSVANRMSNLIDAIGNKYPGVKIILNEVTPRNDDRDSHVRKCNEALVALAEQNELIFLAPQGNLRDESFFRDEKHIKKEKIARYVSNIKTALRMAYGIEDPRRKRRGSGENEKPRSGNTLCTKWEYPMNFGRGQKFEQSKLYPRHPQQYEVRTRDDMEEEVKKELRRKLLSVFD